MNDTAERLAFPDQLAATGVVAILRPARATHVLTTVHALVDAGITCIELTATTPGFPDVLHSLSARYGSEISIGAGTVTDAATARSAIDCGARFLVSPGISEPVVDAAREAALPCLIGAWSPTEVIRAWELGASAVKLFPASSGGVSHLRRLREPFPDIPFVPTGGVTTQLAMDFIRAGATAVGLGGALTGSALVDGEVGSMKDDVARLLAELAAERRRR
ncbi:MAG: 2-keto-3-deoxy-6-phospho-gluconate aldolase-like protein [Aeromicrobium sp.]|nr:2-keto-3-deoxy-6-phospho-gluconate aldolase-like protein [Aeromicrobium sp.]